MEATARADHQRSLPAVFAGLDFQVISTWLLGFGLTVYLGLKGGGFDPLVSDRVGVIVWWVVLAGLLVGAFPRRRLGSAAWLGVGLLTAFLAWTALSLAWTESTGDTNAEIARIATYLGVFALGLSIRGSRGMRLTVVAVGTGIVFLALIALLSRLHPTWFPAATETARFLHSTRSRLSYPLDYWNGVAALVAIGIPLILHMATSSKSVLLRSLAAAALPAMGLTIYFTLSRGGILAGAAAVVVYLAFAGDRVPRLATAGVATVGGAILVGGASQRDALQEGLQSAAAHHQGDQLLWMTIVVCIAVGLLTAAISLVLLNDRRPAWSVPSRRASIISVGTIVVVALVAAVALNAPHRFSDALSEFKSGEVPTADAARLTSATGEERYKLWSAALHEFSSEPLHGTGAGTYELWWLRNGDLPKVVRDTHSLYLQTLGELGIVGIALLGGFVVLVLGAGGRVILRASSRGRSQLAAALAGIVAFFVTAIFDWVWQLPVLPIVMLLLAAPLITATVRSRKESPPIGLSVRGGLAVVALAAIIAIAIPLSSSSLIRASQEDAQAANLHAALEAAQSAGNVEPDAGLPRLQEALVLEKSGNYRAAVSAADAATAQEPANWRNWLTLSRVQAESGNARASVTAYRKAASLNPNSPIFSK